MSMRVVKSTYFPAWYREYDSYLRTLNRFLSEHDKIVATALADYRIIFKNSTSDFIIKRKRHQLFYRLRGKFKTCSWVNDLDVYDWFISRVEKGKVMNEDYVLFSTKLYLKGGDWIDIDIKDQTLL